MALIQEVGRLSYRSFYLLEAHGPEIRGMLPSAWSLRLSGLNIIIGVPGVSDWPRRLQPPIDSVYKREFALRLVCRSHRCGVAIGLACASARGGAGAELIESTSLSIVHQKPDDYESSIEPREFRSLVRRIHEARTALGPGGAPALSSAEAAYSRRMTKYPVSARGITSGAVLGPKDVVLRRLAADADRYLRSLDSYWDDRCK